MLPDDCFDCRVCGCPVYCDTICIDCEPVRDNRGRFVKREIADRYRSLLKRYIGLYGATREEQAEAGRQLNAFWAA